MQVFCLKKLHITCIVENYPICLQCNSTVVQWTRSYFTSAFSFIISFLETKKGTADICLPAFKYLKTSSKKGVPDTGDSLFVCA